MSTGKLVQGALRQLDSASSERWGVWFKKIQRTLFLVAFGTLLLLGGAGVAQAESARIADASRLGPEPLSLTTYLAVLEDPSLEMSWSEVQQADVSRRFRENSRPGESLNFGFTQSAYWFRFSVRNTSDQVLERMLELSANHLSDIEFYAPGATGQPELIKTGDARPFSSRPYNNRFFVFPLLLPAHSEQVYYLRVHHPTGSVHLPLRLWEPWAFHAYERRDYVSLAWYFGMAFGMILFNFLLFVSLRETIYLKYVGFVMLMATSLLLKSGRAKESLPELIAWSNPLVYVSYALTLAALLVFMRDMLNTARTIPRLDRLIKMLMVLLLSGAVGFAVSLQTFANYGVYLYMLTTAGILAIGIYCVVQRQRSAYFFVAAFSLFCLGALVTGLYTVGLLPVNALTSKALQMGSIAEMMLLALALADRYNQMRRDKEKAQTEALAAQQHLVESLRVSEHVLEARVAERTEALNVLNGQLEALSMTDALTGVANRRRFDEVLAREWARAGRSGQPLALVMLDIDWFKKFNDHEGHQVGDQCLRRVAQFLNDRPHREGDLVARYGGEEFAIIAPGTDKANALVMARAICRDLQAFHLPHEVSEFGCITLSIGVAAAIPQGSQGFETLIQHADAALYQAKADGRNRAVAYPCG